MEGLTESEIAGFVVGALLLGASIGAQRVDGFIAASQRRSLNMCKRCSDLRMVACSECKGVGSVRKGGIFTFVILMRCMNHLELKQRQLIWSLAQSADLEAVKAVSPVQCAPRSDDHSIEETLALSGTCKVLLFLAVVEAETPFVYDY